MRSVFIIPLVFATTFLCGQHEPRKFDRKWIKGEFMHFNVKAFSIDSLSMEEKDVDLLWSGEDRYYSSQRNSGGLSELTVYYLEIGEMSDGYRITYLIFKENSLVSSFDVAYSIEELSEKPGWRAKGWGRFLNKTTYELTEESTWINEKEPTISKTLITIKPDGKIERKKSD